MFFEIMLAIVVGVLAGVFTGLIPGIHVNLISALLLGFSQSLIVIAGVLPLAVFIISMATTHTFLDSLPSVFLGAPDSATALGVLPGHRYVLKGWGLMAVKLTIIGSLGALFLATSTFIFLVPLVSLAYPYIKGVMGYLLLSVAFFVIVRDRFKIWALLIFLLSGLLGFIVLNLHLKNALFPMLSGLFGIATLLISLREASSLPIQENLDYTDIHLGKTFQALLSGSFSGFITAILPGVGAATAAMISMQITRRIGDHGFMVLMGGISTANFVFSLVTLLSLGKARNGALVAIQSLISETNYHLILLFLAVALIVGGIASVLALFIGRIFLRLISRISYKKLLIGVISLLIILTPVISGWMGFLVLVVSTAVGLLPALKKTSRTVAMGCLLVPVIFYFL